MRVIYKDEVGFKWVVIVPPNTPEEQYATGAIAGPPDLEELGLVAADLKRLHNGLVDNNVYDGQTLDRGVIRRLLKELDIKLDERWITAIFLREYFE